MRVLFDKGIHLPGPNLWLDPHAPRSSAVVSHAHADHVQRHGEVITTAITAAMLRLRGLRRTAYRTAAFGEPVQLDGARLTLYPAGHILGSAQVLVEWQGVRLLYSGDFKLRPGRSAEVMEVPRADIVVMETTFGRPRYRFPETEAVIAQIHEFCRETLEAGETPVLLCYSLGKGQEVLSCLEGFDWPLYLHEAHCAMARLYRELGVALPEFHLFRPGQVVDGVLLCASGCRRTVWFGNLHRPRAAYLSGWAMDSGACSRAGCDAAFPLSDHADYDDLLDYVELTGAQRVFTVHGFARQFAADLRRLGVHATPLEELRGQMVLF